MEENTNVKETKKTGKFVAVLKKIFVQDIGWKILSLVFACALWVLTVGLM